MLFAAPALRRASGVLLACLLVTGCGGEDGVEVTRVGFEEKGLVWPLSVQEGRLGCDGRKGVGAVWFKTVNGKIYAVNGAAARKHLDIEPIWTIDADITRVLQAAGKKPTVPIRADMGDLIRDGLKLCR